MKKLLAVLLCTCFTNLLYAQVSFEKLSKKDQQEIRSYLAVFSKIPHASAYIAITPEGRIWNNQNYNALIVLGDSVKYDGTPETEFIFRSMTPVPQTSKMYVYNGNTLILHMVVDVRGDMKGQPLKFKVARLETHIKTNGKWQMASGSGTFVEPPTPVANTGNKKN